MRVLITGGTGFLGRHVVWRFVEQGHDVVFTGRNAVAAKQVLAQLPELTRSRARWVALEHGDAKAGQTLKDAAQDTTIVIHCAALASPWGLAAEFDRANITGTEEVLDAVHAARVKRLVHVSTPSLYFDWRDRLSIREDEPLPKPVNEYARSKGVAEGRVHSRPAQETVILRPRALFGPWDLTIMPRLLRAIERGPLPITRSAPIYLDLTYIDNAVDAVWLAATKPLSVPVGTYNVTNGESIALQELLPLVADAFGLRLRTMRLPWLAVDLIARASEFAARHRAQEPTLTRYSAGLLAFSQTLDLTAIRAELGYQPRIKLHEGIRRHAEWHRHGLPA